MAMMMTMASEMQEKNRSSSTGKVISNQVGIVCDILSRLPAKSLMRFKCVSKHWQNMIQDDKYFRDLFHNRSKLRTCLFLAVRLPSVLVECMVGATFITRREDQAELLIADLCGRGRIAAAGEAPVIHNINHKVSKNIDEILKPVNGMICYIDTSWDFGVCIYNLSTGELTPWIKTTFCSRTRKYKPSYQFGFDPATKKHKVICLWESRGNTYSSSYAACEVLTVGDNAWRIIEEIPQDELANDYIFKDGSVYVDGSVYWITNQLKYNNGSEEKFLVAFDVGSEKFRTIAVPKFITDQLLYGKRSFELPVSLFEVNGRVGLLRRICVGHTVKLWILEDNHKMDMSNTDSTTSCNQMWTEVNIELPFQWDEKTRIKFHGVAGTDDILIEAYEEKPRLKCLSLFYFNWKNMTFTKVESDRLCSSIPPLDSRNTSKERYVSIFSTFNESLLPVNMTKLDSSYKRTCKRRSAAEKTRKEKNRRYDDTLDDEDKHRRHRRRRKSQLKIETSAPHKRHDDSSDDKDKR